MTRFTVEMIRRFRIWLPSLAEQEEAVRLYRVQALPIVAAVNRAEREIELIREYRTRLIADVVTGKMDVRGLAPAEPLSADEQINEGIDDDEMLGEEEPELVEEASDE